MADKRSDYIIIFYCCLIIIVLGIVGFTFLKLTVSLFLSLLIWKNRAEAYQEKSGYVKKREFEDNSETKKYI